MHPPTFLDRIKTATARDTTPSPALRRVPVPMLLEFLKLAEERGITPAVLGASAAQIREEIRRREVLDAGAQR